MVKSDQDVVMNWKEDLIEKISGLSAKDFVDGRATIRVTTRVEDWRVFLSTLHCTNSHPVAWVAPGFMKLADFGTAFRFAEEHHDGDSVELYLVFEVMRDQKYNPVVLSSDMKTWTEFPVYGSVDFMSL